MIVRDTTHSIEKRFASSPRTKINKSEKIQLADLGGNWPGQTVEICHLQKEKAK
jgi:hypothetical protein